jgi:Kef-type K+ transport system membrane component KefB
VTPTELSPAFFLAVVVILLACRAMAVLLRGLLQPPVVAEMITGVILGPSLLGVLWPHAETALFPQALRPILYVGGQVGLVIFMFHSGFEMRVDRLRNLARTAGPIAAAGIIVPGALAVGLVVAARGWFDVTTRGTSFTVTALFVGVAVAITAFPMMARIIDERNLAATRFGAVSLTSGAIDDAVAWILLAAVLSLAAGSPYKIGLALGGILLFIALLLVAHRALGRMFTGRTAPDVLILIAVVPLLLAAWYTDRIGLYAVFGAFALGLAFPRTPESERVVEMITPLGRVVFLPLFFVYSGLNTDFALLNNASVLLFALACILIAIVGKLVACTAAARAVGEPPDAAVRIGVLMNARGLMQLIALNVGLAAGLVSTRLFSILVLVALITTTMTTPVLALLDRRDGGEAAAPRAGGQESPEPAPVS